MRAFKIVVVVSVALLGLFGVIAAMGCPSGALPDPTPATAVTATPPAEDGMPQPEPAFDDMAPVEEPVAKSTLAPVEEPVEKKTCPEGQVDTEGTCCWPGQSYSALKGGCVGTPTCPAPLTLVNNTLCPGSHILDDGHVGEGPPHEYNPLYFQN